MASVVPLSRAQFYDLHTRILKKCYGSDAGRVMFELPDNHLYGYNGYEKDPDSLKMKIMELAHVSANTRLLRDERVKYDKGAAEMFFSPRLLGLFLKVIGADFEDIGKGAAFPPENIRNLYSTVNPESVSTTMISIPDEDRVAARLARFANTCWWYYTRTYADSPIILRMVLKVKDKIGDGRGDYAVELLNKGEPFNDFEGRLVKKDSNENILICRLATKEKGAKFKLLMFHIDPSDKKFYMGQATFYDDVYGIRSGTIIITKEENNTDSMKAEWFKIDSEECDKNVPPLIKEYLTDKSLNAIKTPKGITSFEDFRNWLEKKRIKKEKLNPTLIHDLYVACPITDFRIKERVSEDYIQEIETMIKDPLFKKMGINTLHFPSSKILPYTDSSTVLKDEIEEIRRSKAFLLIFPQTDPIITSVTFLSGCAIFSGRPTFIVYKNRDLLPFLLHGAGKLENVRMHSINNPLEVKDIPKWLEANNYYKLVSG